MLGALCAVRLPLAVAVTVSVAKFGSNGGIVVLQPLTDAHLELPTPAPYPGDIDRQNDQAQRDHPEAQDRQETHKAQENKSHANGDPKQAAFRQLESPPGNFDLGHGLTNRWPSHYLQGERAVKTLCAEKPPLVYG